MRIVFQQHAWQAMRETLECNKRLGLVTSCEIDGGVQVEASDDWAFGLEKCLKDEMALNDERIDAAVARGENDPVLARRSAGISQAWKDVHAAIGLATREGQ